LFLVTCYYKDIHLASDLFLDTCYYKDIHLASDLFLDTYYYKDIHLASDLFLDTYYYKDMQPNISYSNLTLTNRTPALHRYAVRSQSVEMEQSDSQQCANRTSNKNLCPFVAHTNDTSLSAVYNATRTGNPNDASFTLRSTSKDPTARNVFALSFRSVRVTFWDVPIREPHLIP
jgi:hypothetical protein